MSVELNFLGKSATYLNQGEYAVFVERYINDRTTTCALYSYSRKFKVYLILVAGTSLNYEEYSYFGGLTFRIAISNGSRFAVYTDPPFLALSIGTVSRFLDSLGLNYKVDTIGVFVQVT